MRLFHAKDRKEVNERQVTAKVASIFVLFLKPLKRNSCFKWAHRPSLSCPSFWPDSNCRNHNSKTFTFDAKGK